MAPNASVQDSEGLRYWLEGRDRQDALCIGHRAALRSAPITWQNLKHASSKPLDATVSTLWLLLVSSVARQVPDPRISDIARTAMRLSPDFVMPAASAAAELVRAIDDFESAVEAATEASLVFGTVASVPNFDSLRSVDSVGSVEEVGYAASDESVAAVWASVVAVCAWLERKQDPFMGPLWITPPPLGFAELWEATRSDWERTGGPVWAFWIKWYENALAGRPQDWSLLHDIALIPAGDWQGGADRVHPIIERMLLERERLKLLDQVEALTAELREARRIISEPVASANARSHNMPPELVDVESEAQRAITIIWADLVEAKKELEKPEPEPSVLRRLGQRLLGAVAAFAEYAVILGDIALRKAAEEIGSTGTKAAVWVFLTIFAAQTGPVQSIGMGLMELAKKMLASP